MRVREGRRRFMAVRGAGRSPCCRPPLRYRPPVRAGHRPGLRGAPPWSAGARPAVRGMAPRSAPGCARCASVRAPAIHGRAGAPGIRLASCPSASASASCVCGAPPGGWAGRPYAGRAGARPVRVGVWVPTSRALPGRPVLVPGPCGVPRVCVGRLGGVVGGAVWSGACGVGVCAGGCDPAAPVGAGRDGVEGRGARPLRGVPSHLAGVRHQARAGSAASVLASGFVAVGGRPAVSPRPRGPVPAGAASRPSGGRRLPKSCPPYQSCRNGGACAFGMPRCRLWTSAPRDRMCCRASGREGAVDAEFRGRPRAATGCGAGEQPGPRRRRRPEPRLPMSPRGDPEPRALRICRPPGSCLPRGTPDNPATMSLEGGVFAASIRCSNTGSIG